jgi:transcriptional regulator with XRE-family HTH domain
MYNIELSQFVKAKRINKSWTQAQLAMIAGLSERTIQRIEKKGIASAESLLALASAFDIDVEQFTSLVKKHNKNIPQSLIPISTRHKAWIGFFVMLPAFYFALTNILFYNLKISVVENILIPLQNDSPFFNIINLFSPLIFLGGLSIALLINLDAIFSLTISAQKTGINTAIRFRPRLSNLTIIFLSLSTLMIFVVYVFVENILLR